MCLAVSQFDDPLVIEVAAVDLAGAAIGAMGAAIAAASAGVGSGDLAVQDSP